MTTETKPLGLHKKLSLAMSKIGRVAKRGSNQAQGYKYARADDVAESAREALAEMGISVSASVTENGVREIETKSGKQRVSFCKVAWTFTDSETGESLTVNAPGEGMDSGDKGVYKAMTGSMKYVLMLNFLIPTGDGDPEVETEHDREERKRTAPRTSNDAARAAVQKATDARPAPIDAYKLEALREATALFLGDDAKAKAWLREVRKDPQGKRPWNEKDVETVGQELVLLRAQKVNQKANGSADEWNLENQP